MPWPDVQRQRAWLTAATFGPEADRPTRPSQFRIPLRCLKVHATPGHELQHKERADVARAVAFQFSASLVQHLHLHLHQQTLSYALDGEVGTMTCDGHSIAEMIRDLARSLHCLPKTS